MTGPLRPLWWTDTLVRIRAELTTDRMGDSVRDWDSATEDELPGFKVNPASSSESSGSADERAQLTTRRVAAGPPDADLLATDRVRWEGRVWEVDGEPVIWRSPLGLVDHLYVQLAAVEG